MRFSYQANSKSFGEDINLPSENTDCDAASELFLVKHAQTTHERCNFGFSEGAETGFLCLPTSVGIYFYNALSSIIKICISFLNCVADDR